MSIKKTTYREEDLTVDPNGMAFMLKNMSSDAGPGQYIRELTQNAIEAGASKILWTIDSELAEKKNGELSKLSLIDNGHGMTGEEMVHYLNRLSVSSGNQSDIGNFGIGAKITAGVKNPHGLIFVSWKNGVGSKVHFWQNPETGRYGLKPLTRTDGTMGQWTDILDTKKPNGIIGDHGTKIILLGKNADDNTVQPPAESDYSGQNWVLRYLNSHYTDLPQNIEIRVSTSPSNNFSAGEIVQERTKYFSEHAIGKGTVALDGVDAHWWLLNDEVTSNTLVECKGHVGVTFQGELYDTHNKRSGHNLLTQAGIITGADRVVIYFAPKETKNQHIKPETSRGGLLVNSKKPPLNEWAASFSEKIPKKLQQYMDKLLKQDPENAANKLRQRLENRGIKGLFESSAYKADTTGNTLLEDTPNGSQDEQKKQPGEENTPIINDPPPTDETTNNEKKLITGLGQLFQEEHNKEAPNRKKGKKIQKLVLPETVWVEGRNDEELEDRAAKFDKKSNKIIIHENFRGYKDLENHILKQFPKSAPNKNLIKAATKEYYAQILVQAVLGVQGLKKDGAKVQEEYDALLTPDALTTTIMVRAEIYDNVIQALKKDGLKPPSYKTGTGPAPV